MNVEQDLHDGKIYMAEVGLFDSDEIDAIPYVIPGLTDKLKIKLESDKAHKAVLEETESAFLANVEKRNKLIYWSVVYGLSLDDQAAYKKRSLEYIENYIEYGLSKHFDVYENLGLEILTISGLDELIPELESDEIDLTSKNDAIEQE